MLLCLGWSTPLAFSSPCSFNFELSTFLKLCVSHLIKALSYSSLGTLPSSCYRVNRKWNEEGRRREVGKGNFGIQKGVEKSLGMGKGCVFYSSPKRLERPHPKMMHQCLLVHSSQCERNIYFWKVEDVGCVHAYIYI
jgi:hypothetical protein